MVKIPEKTRLAMINDLKKYDGFPPYDKFNPCQGDGYFAISLERRYRMSVNEMRKVSGYDKIAKKINKLLKEASKITS